jgi:hypothetical protein
MKKTPENRVKTGVGKGGHLPPATNPTAAPIARPAEGAALADDGSVVVGGPAPAFEEWTQAGTVQRIGVSRDLAQRYPHPIPPQLLCPYDARWACAHMGSVGYLEEG